MDCSVLLKAQQQDFYARLQIGNLLVCSENNLHSESCILEEEAIEKINLESIIEAQNVVDNYLLEVSHQDIFNSLFYRRLTIEAFLFQFGNLVWLDNIEQKDYSELSLTQSFFSIKNNSNIKILIKTYQGDINQIKLELSLEEIQNSQVFVFAYFVHNEENTSQYFQPIFLGFTTIDLLNKNETKQEILVKDLLYIGGLSYYLSNEVNINEPLQLLAKKQIKQGKYLQAIETYNQITRSGDTTEKNIFNRGICYYKLDKKKLALRDFSRVIQLNHLHSLAYHWLGYICLELEKYPEALNNYNQEIKLDSHNFFAYFQRALVYLKLNQLIDALEDYSIALKINNQFFQGYYNRAYLYYQLKDSQSAIEDYKMALKIKPNLVQAHYNLGVIYQELNDYQEAIEQYRLAIKINPRYVNAYYNLAILQANLGLFEKSLNHYKEVIKIAPDFIQGSYNYKSLKSLLKNEGNILLDSLEYTSTLEQTPGIVSIDDHNLLKIEDEAKYTTLGVNINRDTQPTHYLNSV